MNETGICYTCRGKGLAGGCPKCGKKPSLGKKGDVVVTTTLLEKNVIPAEYNDIRWDINELKVTHPSKCSDKSFLHYCDQLTKIFGIFDEGLLPTQSAIIIGRRGMGKMTLAYTCMRQALQHGYTVCPILDNTQIKRINALSSDNNRSYYLYKVPSIDDIVYSDVLFITVDKDNYSTALRTIESVMDKRARLGLSTFILSRYSLDMMTQFEKKDTYLSLIDPTRKYNSKKYPVIIKCL